MNRLEISLLKGVIRNVKGILTAIDKKLDKDNLKSDDKLISESKSFITILCKSWIEYAKQNNIDVN